MPTVVNVITLAPGSSGTSAVHCIFQLGCPLRSSPCPGTQVSCAVPLAPRSLDQATYQMAYGSTAVPVNVTFESGLVNDGCGFGPVTWTVGGLSVTTLG